MEEESDISSKRTKSSSSGRTKKGKQKKSKKIKSETEPKSKDTNELSLSVKNSKNIEKCLSYLESYFNNLNTTNLDNIITEKNLKHFQKLNEIENIEIDLLLTKIYNKIFGAESLYTSFFSDHEENEAKIEVTLELIEEVLNNIENFDNDVISFENFELKVNTLKLITFIKINLKEDLQADETKQLDSYLNELPGQFYSKNYLELMKYKSKIYKSNNALLKNIENIDELLSNLESYYEQLSVIENLFGDIEIKKEVDTKNYKSISKKDIKKKKRKKKSRKNDDSDEEESESDSEEDETDIPTTKESKEKITEDDLINYGQFLVNICVYQQFELKKIKKKDLIKKKPQKKDQKQKSKPKPKPKQKQKSSKIKNKKGTTEEEDEEEEEEEEDDEKNENQNEEEENQDNIEEEEEEEESEDDPQNCETVFLADAEVKKVKEKGKGKKKSKESLKFSDLLEGKICKSLMERKNLFEIIKNNYENFKILSKNSKNKEIKEIKEKLELYITSIEEGKKIQINSGKIDQIKYYNNFSNNKVTVKNRDSKVFYIQNNENKKGILLIEFYLTDESKDIIFNLSRYDIASDDFSQIYTSNKINKKCKICIYFDEKALYQLEFNNEYSWLNSKEVNYNISIFRILDDNEIPKENEIKTIKEENNIDNNINNEEKLDIDEENIKENNNIVKTTKKEKKEKKEKIENEIKEAEEEEEINTKEIKISSALLNNEKQITFTCKLDNVNFDFNCNKIYNKIKEHQDLEKNNTIKKSPNEISLLIYRNKISFVTIDENNKINYSEFTDDKDNIVTKKFFNKILFSYLKEKIKKENEEDNQNNKVIINLYCANKNLSHISPKIRELISSLENYSINNEDKFMNKIYIQFLEKLGFYPNKKISNYEIKYNLYDFTDQCLIYHLFLNHIQERKLKNSTLVMIFDKESIHITAMNKGTIFNKYKTLEKNWKAKYYSQMKYDDMKSICNFIKALSNSFKGFDLVLCSINNGEKNEEYENKFKQIKQFVDEKLEEQIRVFVYYEDKFIVDMLKYIEMFLDE